MLGRWPPSQEARRRRRGQPPWLRLLPRCPSRSWHGRLRGPLRAPPCCGRAGFHRRDDPAAPPHGGGTGPAGPGARPAGEPPNRPGARCAGAVR